MKPTIELDKEQFLDRIQRELDFNEAAMNMVDNLWDDLEGKSISLSSLEGVNAYYPAFIDELLSIVYGFDIEEDDICRFIKECINYDEVVSKKVDGMTENEFNQYRNETINKDSNKNYRQQLKDMILEDNLGYSNEDLNNMSNKRLETIYDNRIKKKAEILHIPDDQELSAEEINAYLLSCGLTIGEEFSMPEVQHELRFIENLLESSRQTKEKFLEILNKRLSTFEPYKNIEFESKYRGKVTIVDVLSCCVENFDEKFDKCMAAFLAKKEKQNPKSVAKEARETAKGASGKVKSTTQVTR